MLERIADQLAKISIEKLQKRIDALHAEQEKINQVTKLRTLNELEHYRLQLNIGMANYIMFGTIVLFCGLASLVATHMTTGIEKLLTALCLAILILIVIGIWEGTCYKTVMFWRAASPINQKALQDRIDTLQADLTARMAKRFNIQNAPDKM